MTTNLQDQIASAVLSAPVSTTPDVAAALAAALAEIATLKAQLAAPPVSTREAELQAQIAALKSEIASKPTATLSLRTAEKGGISIIGLNKQFPVTLYAGQWLKVFSIAKSIASFIVANSDRKAAPAVGDKKPVYAMSFLDDTKADVVASAKAFLSSK